MTLALVLGVWVIYGIIVYLALTRTLRSPLRPKRDLNDR